MVYMARVTDQVERYRDMVDFLKAVIDAKDEYLNSEERNLFSVGFKNYISSARTAWRTITAIKSICLSVLAISKSRERNAKVEAGFGTGAGAYDEAGAYVGAGDGTPSGSNPREPLFLINYINIFNSRGQFPSYLIYVIIS